MRHIVYSVLALGLWVTAQAAWSAPRPVRLDPIQHMPAELVVVERDGREVSYSPADLESFSNYRLSTTTPWRDEEADFDGILLRDLLEAHGLEDAAAIRVIAENDYVSVVPRALWAEIDVLIATRVDGRPHSRRDRGPIQLVIDQGAMERSDIANQGHLVWMAARIEMVE